MTRQRSVPEMQRQWRRMVLLLVPMDIGVVVACFFVLTLPEAITVAVLLAVGMGATLTLNRRLQATGSMVSPKFRRADGVPPPPAADPVGNRRTGLRMLIAIMSVYLACTGAGAVIGYALSGEESHETGVVVGGVAGMVVCYTLLLMIVHGLRIVRARKEGQPDVR